MNKLFLSLEDFYEKLQNGDFDEPLVLALILQNLSDAAWSEVEELYQPSIRIEP
jgi:hypothetical protein